MIAPNRSLQCDYISGLLPWYVNGTLAAELRRQADAHIGECACCSQDFAAECHLAASIQERPAAPTQTPYASWERFAAQLDAPAPFELEALELDQPGRSAAVAPFRPRRRWLVPLAVGQAAVIALLGIVLLTRSKDADPVNNFHTLSAVDPTVTASGDLVRLAFASSPAATEIERFLHTIGARIVSGPTASNVYTLALDGSGKRGRTRASALMWLQQQPGVVLAEPVARADGP